MAEPELDAPAALVRQYDPALFRTALFAPEPGRGRLLTLYALDIELSRALSRTDETMISLMRLQWWRDVVAAAVAGEPAPAHEVARPVHALVAERTLPVPLLEGLIEAREIELEGVSDRARFADWADKRYGGLTLLAAELLVPGAAERAGMDDAARAAGQALAAAFAIRNAAPMAAEEGRPLLPDLPGESLAPLARGSADAGARCAVRRVAEHGLANLSRARGLRRAVPPGARPAFLPLASAEPVLRHAARPQADMARLAAPNAARAAAGTLWRALSGRW